MKRRLEQPLQPTIKKNAACEILVSLPLNRISASPSLVINVLMRVFVRCWSTGLAVKLWSSSRSARSMSWGSERWDKQQSSVFSWRAVSITLTLWISQRILRDERSDTLESTLIRLEEEQQRCGSCARKIFMFSSLLWLSCVFPGAEVWGSRRSVLFCGVSSANQQRLTKPCGTTCES